MTQENSLSPKNQAALEWFKGFFEERAKEDERFLTLRWEDLANRPESFPKRGLLRLSERAKLRDYIFRLLVNYDLLRLHIGKMKSQERHKIPSIFQGPSAHDGGVTLGDAANLVRTGIPQVDEFDDLTVQRFCWILGDTDLCQRITDEVSNAVLHEPWIDEYTQYAEEEFKHQYPEGQPQKADG